MALQCLEFSVFWCGFTALCTGKVTLSEISRNWMFVTTLRGKYLRPKSINRPTDGQERSHITRPGGLAINPDLSVCSLAAMLAASETTNLSFSWVLHAKVDLVSSSCTVLAERTDTTSAQHPHSARFRRWPVWGNTNRQKAHHVLELSIRYDTILRS